MTNAARPDIKSLCPRPELRNHKSAQQKFPFVSGEHRAGLRSDGIPVRYGQRGGYTPAERKRWERVRLQAAESRRGPLAWGYTEDQCWTLGRIKTLIGLLFHRQDEPS